MSAAARIGAESVSSETRDATWAALRAQLRQRTVERDEARRLVEQLEEENRRLREELARRGGT